MLSTVINTGGIQALYKYTQPWDSPGTGPSSHIGNQGVQVNYLVENRLTRIFWICGTKPSFRAWVVDLQF